jgi:hypothetical protein
LSAPVNAFGSRVTMLARHPIGIGQQQRKMRIIFRQGRAPLEPFE